jgi:tetratricopeptide (TPR) repeat protein
VRTQAAGLPTIVVLAALMACTRSAQTPDRSAPDAGDLRPVALPDLSRAVPSVQVQLRERHAALLSLAARDTPPADLAASYGEMGMLFMAAQYPDAAEASLVNAQQLNTGDFRWPYYLGHLYRTQGDLAKSAALFERCLQMRPDDVDTLVWLGNIYLSLDRHEAADGLFAKALALQPSSLSARYGLGRAALARNDYSRAVTYLEEVLTRDPTAAGAHYPLSQAYRALGDLKKADEHLGRRMERDILPADPLMVELDGLLDSPQTYETLGIRALDRRDWPGAASEFKKGLALAPDSAALHHRLGTALSMIGDAKAAEAEFLEAVRLSPEYFPAQYSLGVLRQAEGRHAEAIERFTAALRARPGYTEAHIRLAASLRRTGRAKESLAHYEQALASSPDFAQRLDATFGAAVALSQSGRYRDALTRLEQARTAFSDQVIFTHGVARLLASAPDDTVRDGQRAMSLVQELVARGRTIDLGETMAMALAELGEYDRAASLQADLIAAAGKAQLTGTLPRLKANLARYERREPCRTPWAVDEIP